MTKQEYEQKQEYLKQKEQFVQMRVEEEMDSLSRQLNVYRICDQTVLSTLEKSIEPLLHRLNTLNNQIKSFNERIK